MPKLSATAEQLRPCVVLVCGVGYEYPSGAKSHTLVDIEGDTGTLFRGTPAVRHAFSVRRTSTRTGHRDAWREGEGEVQRYSQRMTALVSKTAILTFRSHGPLSITDSPSHPSPPLALLKYPRILASLNTLDPLLPDP